MEITWPAFVSKPDLPDGYKWECLAQAQGMEGLPWYIRVSWSYPHKLHGTCSRILKVSGFYPTPIKAVKSAMRTIEDHQEKRKKTK